MIKITINNSLCKIEGVPAEAEKAIKFNLRYLSKNVSYVHNQNLREITRIRELLNSKRFSSNSQHLNSELIRLERQNSALNHKMYVCLYKKGEFPTGLLPKVKEVLADTELQYEVVDERVKPTRNSVKYILRESLPQMRYYQRTGARLAVENGRGILIFPTGTGKTLTVTRMIWELGVKTLVITPSKSITDNMIDTLTKYFGKGKVGRLNTKSGSIKDINVCNIQALVKIKPEVLKEIDAVFIDEFHHAAADTYQEVNFNHLKHCFYRIGVTATNFRNDGADMSLEGVLSEVLYEYTIPQAMEDKFLVRPEFRIIDFKNDCDENSYQQQYKMGIVENETRNETIASIAKEHGRDFVLILVQQLEHGESLKKLIPNSEFLHGEEKDVIRQRVMEDYREGRIHCLIGTSVIGEGVDLPVADTLVMAGGGKAKGAVMQNIGRVLRPYLNKDRALVYDFSDKGSSYLQEHSLLRQEVYKQYETK